ncbi:protein FRA10AC1 [Episyrphus balteatus]|uniref:protein FRA10AC1 n=1 Tax=Episyrphus balteatus TaxID=286459 RepID=UPI0024850AF3|nr:protein FRA10AC1 [Episyrphus balteatus]
MKNLWSNKINKIYIKKVMFPIQSLNGQDRHDYILKNFILNKAASQNSKHKRDIDVIRENHKFLWEDEDVPDSWESRLAKKYYDKLFKEYCISDLTRYKENKIALRWRTEQEVVSGKGQFICGSRKCPSKETLRSWEVNFAYMEKGQKMNALIKLRLCPDCSKLLNYTHQKREVKKQKRLEKSKHKISKRKKSKNDNDDEEVEDVEKSQSETVEEEEPSSSTTLQDESCSGNTESRQEEAMNIWSKPEVEIETVEREEEFEKYLEDLLL